MMTMAAGEKVIGLAEREGAETRKVKEAHVSLFFKRQKYMWMRGEKKRLIMSAVFNPMYENMRMFL